MRCVCRVWRSRADPGEQVLAARDGRLDPLAGQVEGRVRGHPEVGLDQHRAGERLVEVQRGAPDGVALGHRAQRSRRASRTSAAVSSGRSRDGRWPAQGSSTSVGPREQVGQVACGRPEEGEVVAAHEDRGRHREGLGGDRQLARLDVARRRPGPRGPGAASGRPGPRASSSASGPTQARTLSSVAPSRSPASTSASLLLPQGAQAVVGLGHLGRGGEQHQPR